MDIMIPLNEKAYDVMGMHIQSMVNKLKLKQPEDFSFIKIRPCDEEFADMVFRYKNQVYAILMDINYNEKHVYLSDDRKRDFIKIAKQNNLIPCLFNIKIDLQPEETEHGYGVKVSEFEMPDIKYSLQNSDAWNLTNAETNKPVNPLDMASDESIVMSDYELYNFAVLVASQLLEQQGLIIKSISDMPEYYPQMILKNHEGREFWCIIAYSTKYDTDEMELYKEMFKDYVLKATNNNNSFADFMGMHDGILFSLFVKNTSRTDVEHNYKYNVTMLSATK